MLDELGEGLGGEGGVVGGEMGGWQWDEKGVGDLGLVLWR